MTVLQRFTLANCIISAGIAGQTHSISSSFISLVFGILFICAEGRRPLQAQGNGDTDRE